MTKKENKILILGHKNPDTDSICSAIAYANLKNEIVKKENGTENYVPMRAGQISNETKFVLERFEKDIPDYISDVGIQIRDVEIKKTEGINSDISLKQAWSIMRDTVVSTLPVTNEDNELVGVISVKDIATANMDIYDNKILSKAHTKVKNLLESLEGKLIVGNSDDAITKGKIIVAAGTPDVFEKYVSEGDIVILGNRYDAQLCAIQMNAGCIIICMNSSVSETIKKLAQEHNCIVIVSPHDTYTTARILNQSTPIGYFMKTKDLVTFNLDGFVEEIRPIMAKIRHRNFPIVDSKGKYCGMISRRSLLEPKKKKVILVDHNEKTQAVDGIEQAEILEIIDHHKLGTIETISPVFFRNQPLGCTATIVYQMYNEKGIKIEPKIAGLLCSAIISDTLMYRSPTCTELDKIAAEDLAKIAGIDVKTHADEMFSAGSNLKEKSPEEIFYQDYKKFNAGEVKFGVGQITAMNPKVFEDVKPRLMEYMKKTFESQGVDMILMMLTSIMNESTELIMMGDNAQEYMEEAFNKQVVDNSVLLEGVVSRKKQLIPSIMLAIQK